MEIMDIIEVGDVVVKERGNKEFWYVVINSPEGGMIGVNEDNWDIIPHIKDKITHVYKQKDQRHLIYGITAMIMQAKNTSNFYLAWDASNRKIYEAIRVLEDEKLQIDIKIRDLKNQLK